MRRTTILLADDHPVFAQGIRRILEGRFEVIGSVADGSALFEAADRLHPDVIICDISMPTLSGFEGLRELRAAHHHSQLVFLTMHADARLAAEAFRLGARGFVLKQHSAAELVPAIDVVVQGHLYVSPALSDEVLALLSEFPVQRKGEFLGRKQKPPTRPSRLGGRRPARPH